MFHFYKKDPSGYNNVIRGSQNKRDFLNDKESLIQEILDTDNRGYLELEEKTIGGYSEGAEYKGEKREYRISFEDRRFVVVTKKLTRKRGDRDNHGWDWNHFRGTDEILEILELSKKDEAQEKREQKIERENKTISKLIKKSQKTRVLRRDLIKKRNMKSVSLNSRNIF